MIEMKKFPAVVFDMDGTLANSLEDLMDSVNFAMARFGFPSKTIGEVRRAVGNGVARLVELSVPGGLDNPHFDNCLQQFRDHYETNKRNKTRPYDGIMELLEALKNQHVKMAIVSNKPDTPLKELCADFFGEFISIAVGESEGTARKPAPDMVFKVLEALDVTPDQALYVGDSEVDAVAAHNAGLKFVGVTWGFRDRALLEEKGAAWIIERPEELLEILTTAANN